MLRWTRRRPPRTWRPGGGEHEEGDGRPAGPQAPGDIGSRDVREADIEHDRIDPGARLGDLERPFAGAGELHQVTLLGQQALEERAEAGIVFDDEEMHRG